MGFVRGCVHAEVVNQGISLQNGLDLGNKDDLNVFLSHLIHHLSQTNVLSGLELDQVLLPVNDLDVSVI